MSDAMRENQRRYGTPAPSEAARRAIDAARAEREAQRLKQRTDTRAMLERDLHERFLAAGGSEAEWRMQRSLSSSIPRRSKARQVRAQPGDRQYGHPSADRGPHPGRSLCRRVVPAAGVPTGSRMPPRPVGPRYSAEVACDQTACHRPSCRS